jgi:hypothetical protein
MSSKPSDSQPLSEQYPVHSSWELTLTPTGIVRGRVYTTDQASGSIVLLADPHQSHIGPHNKQQQQTNTQQQQSAPPMIHIIQAKHVVQAKPLRGSSAIAIGNVPDLPPIPTKVSRKALEEREKKAIRLAEESFRNVNDKVSEERPMRFRCVIFPCQCYMLTCLHHPSNTLSGYPGRPSML